MSRLAAVLAAAALLSTCGCARVTALWYGGPEIDPQALNEALQGSSPPLVLALQDEADYAGEGHIPGAVRIEESELAGYLYRLGPDRRRAIVVACTSGVRSLSMAAGARDAGYLHAESLSGGMSRWRELGLPQEKGAGERPSPELLAPVRVEATLLDQLVIVVTAFGAKPGYMLLSLVLCILLWRRRERDLRLIFWGVLLFEIGEAFCALNYLVANESSVTLELLHQLGMVGMAAALPWGLFEMVDSRMLRFSANDRGCTLGAFCGRCWKRHDDASCALYRLMLVAAPVLLLSAFLPLSTPIFPTHMVVDVFGTDVVYEVGLILAFTVYRTYPLLAIFFLVVTMIRLAKGKAGIARAHMPFFLGFGFLFFAWFRFGLRVTFHSAPWLADAWEELLELASIVAVALLLWLLRRQLGLATKGLLQDVPEA